MSSPAMAGIFAPVVTPFDGTLRPDPEPFIEHCRWLVRQDCGLAIFGTNSEGNSLSVEEREALIDQAVDAGIPAARMMPGTGACAIPDAVRLSRHAVRAGCGGVLMLPPFYYKGVSDDGLYRFFAEVIQRVGDSAFRLYLYHIPPVSAVPVSLALIERLLRDYPGVVAGIKDSSGDMANASAMLKAFPGFSVFAGSELTLLQTMREGGAGCITATGNIHVSAIRDLYENWRAPDAADRQEKLNAFRKVMQRYPMIPALKRIIADYTGRESWAAVRPPLIALDEAQARALRRDIAEVGFSMAGGG